MVPGIVRTAILSIRRRRTAAGFDGAVGELRGGARPRRAEAGLRPARRALGALPQRRRAHLEGKGSLRPSRPRRRRRRPAGLPALRGFGVASEIRTYRQRAFEHANRYQLHVAGSPRALQLLNEAGVLDATPRAAREPPPRVVARACCRAAYLRGALLGSGSLSGAALAAPRDPHRQRSKGALPGRASPRARGSSCRRRARPARRRLRQGRRGDRRRARACRGVRRRCWPWPSTRSSARRAPTRTGSRTPTTRTSSGRAARRSRSSRRSGGSSGPGGSSGLSPTLREVAELRLRHPSRSVRSWRTRSAAQADAARPPGRLRARRELSRSLERLARSGL